MINWDDAIKEALHILQYKDQYCYFYGAKGEVMTDSMMNALWEAYPDYFKKYSSDQKKAIFNYSRNKIGYDCSGFVGHCVGNMTYSKGLIDNCSKTTTNPYEGVAGSVLWKQGHCAIDVGYGYYLHFPSEMHSCELERFKEGKVNWELSGQHNNIDYSGATER